MRENTVKRICSGGGVAINGWLSTGSAVLAEVAGHQGFDSLTVDMQHGVFGIDSAVSMLQAISSTPAMPFVRVPSNNPAVIMHVLDAGAYGLICPMVNSVEEAKAFVSASQYPPRGSRSFGPVRGLLYGGSDYIKHADDEIIKLAMIETRAGVDSYLDILDVPGLDGILVGPSDLALALGGTPAPEPTHELTARTIEEIAKATRAKGKIAAIFCSDGKAAKMRTGQGYNLVTPNTDINLFRTAAQAAVRDIRS